MICEYTSELSNSVTGLQKLCMKPWQSLFLLVMAPSKLATSRSQTHISHSQSHLCKRLQRPFLKSYSHHCYSLSTDPPPPRSLSPPIFAEGRVSVHRRHCYTYYQDLLRKRELKHYITITLRCVLKRKRTKTIFLKILFFFFHRVT